MAADFPDDVLALLDPILDLGGTYGDPQAGDRSTTTSRTYLLVPDTRRPDRLVAIARMTHFSPYRPTPFGGMWFAVEGGTLVIAAPDA